MRMTGPPGFVVHEIAPGARVRVRGNMPVLPPVLDREVERLWRVASSRMARGAAGGLFNGLVFTADILEPTGITGHLTEYRRVVAQMEQPALFGDLRLRPLAVCGVLRCDHGLVFGRRHKDAVYQAGMWQLPPAGSVDAGAVDRDGEVYIRSQLMAELREEVGLAPSEVREPRPICLVEHPSSHVLDFGLELTTTLAPDRLLAAHRERGNGEYDPLLIVPDDGLAAFLAGPDIVPAARVFLERLGLPRDQPRGQPAP